MKTLGSFAALLILTGCAALGAADCGPDWYAIGERDGRIGAQPQDANYERRCSGAVDSARYRQGWQNGARMRPGPPA